MATCMNCSSRSIKINFSMGVEAVKSLHSFKVLNLLTTINKMEQNYKLNTHSYVLIDWRVIVGKSRLITLRSPLHDTLILSLKLNIDVCFDEQIFINTIQSNKSLQKRNFSVLCFKSCMTVASLVDWTVLRWAFNK